MSAGDRPRVRLRCPSCGAERVLLAEHARRNGHRGLCRRCGLAAAMRNRFVDGAEDVNEATAGRCQGGASSCDRRRCRYWLRSDELGSHCALVVAGDGPRSYEDVGRALGISRQRVHTHLVEARQKLEELGVDLDDPWRNLSA